MYCKICGAEIRDNAKFCDQCGKVIFEDDESVPPGQDFPFAVAIDIDEFDSLKEVNSAEVHIQTATKNEIPHEDTVKDMPKEEPREKTESKSGMQDLTFAKEMMKKAKPTVIIFVKFVKKIISQKSAKKNTKEEIEDIKFLVLFFVVFTTIIFLVGAGLYYAGAF